VLEVMKNPVLTWAKPASYRAISVQRFCAWFRQNHCRSRL